ncbi:isochorismate synthase [Polaribacter sp.]|nr:isochorismate synthase [Polaribacter sp.]
MKKIFNKIENSLKQQKPFVVYRKPDAVQLKGVFLESTSLLYSTEFKESGFVFAPFDSEEKAILFPFRESLVLSEKIAFEESSFSEEDEIFQVNEIQRKKHLKLVTAGIDEIEKTELTKIVLSRSEGLRVEGVDLVKILKKLLYNYKNAFVYLWFHPEIGLWMGATPETLLKLKNKHFETMSLAGTQPFIKDKKIVWGKKELEEQQLVTNFIESQLKDISSDLTIFETETVKAGKLLHLRSKITGNLKDNCSLKSIVRSLHPTPAVCGFPRNLAKNFIVKNENYNRSFYTGFLGEINNTDEISKYKKSHLFVNLRCMEVLEDEVKIFIGGGITKASNPEKEWLETVAKSKTIKNVLTKF